MANTSWFEAHQTLVRWLSHPELLSEEDIGELPSSATIAVALQLIDQLSAGPAPTSVLPDGSGGIRFEWRNKPDVYRYLAVLPSGQLEIKEFEQSKITHSQRVDSVEALRR